MPETPCGVCGGRVGEVLYPLDVAAPSATNYTIVACSTCGTHRIEPPPLESDLRAAAESQYFDVYADPSIRAAKVKDLDRAMATVRLPERFSILEVGCADGYLTEDLIRRGHDALGIEYEVRVARRAQERIGDTVVHGDFLAVELGRTFDVVLMFDVLEHLADPVAGLQRAHDVLEPGGVVLVVTPDAGSVLCKVMGRRWLGYYLEHRYCLARAAGPVLAVRSDMDLVRSKRFTKTVTAKYAIGKAAYRFGGLAARGVAPGAFE